MAGFEGRPSGAGVRAVESVRGGWSNGWSDGVGGAGSGAFAPSSRPRSRDTAHVAHLFLLNFHGSRIERAPDFSSSSRPLLVSPNYYSTAEGQPTLFCTRIKRSNTTLNERTTPLSSSFTSSVLVVLVTTELESLSLSEQSASTKLYNAYLH